MSQSTPLRRKIDVNQASEAIFKIVAVSHEGAADWVQRVHDLTRPEHRGTLHAPPTSAGWRYSQVDIAMAGLRVEGHPVRLYLFGHEGVGFVGQPGAAKDVVYKNLHVLMGFARPSDVDDVLAVLEPDLARLHSQQRTPACFVACPSQPRVMSGALSGAGWNECDWRADPLAPLRTAVKAIVVAHP